MIRRDEDARRAGDFGKARQDGRGAESERTSEGAQSHVDNFTTLPVMLDAGRYYQKKPTGQAVAGITRRMQAAGPSEVTPAELCEHIRRGGTWCGGCYAASDGAWGPFQGMRLFGLDFDNERRDKTPIKPGERGYMEPNAAARRALDSGLSVACLYPTFSFSFERVKFRLVIDAGEVVTDEDKARAVLVWLNELFPEADPACKNPNRLFFGTRGGVVETWEYWPRLLGGDAS